LAASTQVSFSLSSTAYQNLADKDYEWAASQISNQNLDKGTIMDGGKAASFPNKLNAMLELVEESGHSAAVRWLAHGRGFKIFNKHLFETEVLPIYFQGQTKFTSFQRQLNIYGFLRLTRKGYEDHNGYYHERFLRGHAVLRSTLLRNFVSRPSADCILDSATQPDFASMEPSPTSDESLSQRMQPTFQRLLVLQVFKNPRRRAELRDGLGSGRNGVLDRGETLVLTSAPPSSTRNGVTPFGTSPPCSVPHMCISPVLSSLRQESLYLSGIGHSTEPKTPSIVVSKPTLSDCSVPAKICSMGTRKECDDRESKQHHCFAPERNSTMPRISDENASSGSSTCGSNMVEWLGDVEFDSHSESCGSFTTVWSGSDVGTETKRRKGGLLLDRLTHAFDRAESGERITETDGRASINQYKTAAYGAQVVVQTPLDVAANSLASYPGSSTHLCLESSLLSIMWTQIYLSRFNSLS
jgi:HSF-type DNA-binding